MLILFFKRFSGTVSSYLTFVWKVWEQGGGCSFLSLSLSYTLSTALCISFYPVGLLWPFFEGFFLFILSFFCCFHFTPPSWMHPCSSFPAFFFPGSSWHADLGSAGGRCLKKRWQTITLSETHSSAAQSTQASSVQPSRASVGPSCFGPAKIKVGDTPE